MRIPSIYPRRRARIEIIPLIDIIFFLLATFMVVSMSMVKNLGLTVQLPQALSAMPQSRDAAATISITQEGDFYLNKDKMPLDNLRESLKVLKDTQPQLKILINSDEHADFGRVMSVFDEVRLLGISEVSVQTKK